MHAANVCTCLEAQVKIATPCRERKNGRRVICNATSLARSNDSAGSVALLRASLFFTASADDRAEDLALGAITVGLQELDVAIDED